MIASTPVRLVSLTIVAAVLIVGVRGMIRGFAVGGDLDATFGARPAAAGKSTAAVVAYVVDGDTVQVSLAGSRDIRVRLLGISAPEVPHAGLSGECYGLPATRHLRKLLPAGTHVKLVRDPSQDDVDTYGRRLRYVETAARDIGRVQIRSGSAAARASVDPVARVKGYERAEALARRDGLGIWTACR